MADDTQTTETDEQETGSQEVTQPEQPKSIDSVVEKRMKQADDKAAGIEPPEKAEKPEVSGDIEKKESKGERIQRLYREEKQRNEQLQEKVSSLEVEVKSIKERFASGDISKTQADREITEAKQDFSKAMEGITLSPDLEPYKDELLKLADAIAKQQIGPLKDQLQGLLAERNQGHRQQMEKEAKEFDAKVITTYAEYSKQYPHLFNKSKEGVEPTLKPEFDKQAQEVFARYSRPMLDAQGRQAKDASGQPVFYNTLLDPDNPDSIRYAMDFLFSHLNVAFDKAEKAKSENQKVEQLRKTRIETPGGNSNSSGKKSVDDIVAKHMRQLNT